ncbi:MAG: glycosyltransferase family 4 protein [Patescibacteria group bacterium]
MKILRIVYEWPSPWIGLVPQPFEITRSQAKMGHQITVLCGRWPNAGNLITIPGVSIKPFIREPLKGVLLVTIAPLMFLYYLVWRGNNTPDLIHAHGHFGLWLFYYRKLLKRFRPNHDELKIPLVVHFHNCAQARWNKLVSQGKSISFVTQKLAYPLEVFANELALQVADAYICVSNDVKNEFIELHGANAQKMFVVESGVNVNLFAPVGPDEKEKTRRDLGLINSDRVILFHGMMVERKNVHLLVDAIKLLPSEYKLLLIGDGDSSYMQRLTDQIKEKQLESRVFRVGYTEYPKIHIGIQAADISVLPADYEGLPKTVLESLACGVPVLGSGFKAANEINGLIYLDDLNPESLAAKIKSMLDTPVKVDRSKVAQLYSWNIKAHEIEQVYNFVLDKDKGVFNV